MTTRRWLRGAVTMAAALLCGCVSRLAPSGPALDPPGFTAAAFRPGDGALLPLRVWLPEGPPRAVVLALHGMNDYSNAFDAAGRALAARAIQTYAYDQRGFGGAPFPGLWAGGSVLAADANACLAVLAARHPGLPVILLGESMGGAVAIEAVTRYPAPAGVRGVVLSAPAVWGRTSMGAAQRAALWLADALFPGLTLSGRGLDIQPSDNIGMLRALSRDPLVIKETRVDAIAGLVDLMDTAQAGVARLPLPVLLLYGERDQVIPPEPIGRAVAALPRRCHDQRVARYPEGWHMLLRDLQAARVVADIAAWSLDPAAPLPSGHEWRQSCPAPATSDDGAATPCHTRPCPVVSGFCQDSRNCQEKTP